MVRSEFAKEDMIDAQSTLKFCRKYSWMSPESKITLCDVISNLSIVRCQLETKDKNFILGLT